MAEAPGVLVVGLGFVAEGYLHYLRDADRARLVAVADPFEPARQRAAEVCSFEAGVDDYREVLERPDVDVVIVCTPHNLHHPVVTDALRAGKDVLCEKPIAVNVAEADEMIDLARDRRRTLLVGLNMRFSGWSWQIDRLLGEGAVGRVVFARASYLGYETKRFNDPNNWKGDLVKAGGGVLLDGGYHVVDLLNWYLGRAKAVQALGGRRVIEPQNKGEDNVGVLIEYENGAFADLFASFTTCNVGCDREPTLFLSMDVSGTEATLLSGYDSARRHQSLEVVKPVGRDAIDLAPHGIPDKHDHFFDCIAGRDEPRVTALDGRNATAVVEAAYESIRSGNRVDVDWRDE